MNDLGPSLLICAALGIVVLIFLRLQKRGFGQPPGAALAAAQAGAPVGSVVPLGQNAVAPDRQWLLLKVGQ